MSIDIYLSYAEMVIFNYYKSTDIINNINELKDKSHMVISRVAQKDFDKTHCTFMIEVLKRVGLGGTFPNKIKVIYDKATGNIILNREKLKTMMLKLDMRHSCLKYYQ